ncbi:ArnT family glycosyltransferase [Dinghuibacter silviterrae]|uniref:Dolichyl-phosphate-mannose-protein mannosyltransferase n=1 Tax=Dinghuibacter silviterrae TaxID=1539049 RepID=A0A4R8DPH7_9BACT|nr:glycosyltransferase family 39 protein [Dinghuibacter silviterrae]TDW99196.1 dolichyl-phosphate-mannose-protein mannosyltransferase [Dinghuibacter silviterrae]
MEKKDAQRKVLIVMVCSLILRIVAANMTELGNDEVYYALYPRYPDWSYFDHPAMIAWVVRLLNGGHLASTAWAMRLPALVFGTINLYLAFLLGSALRSPRCGFYATLLYASSLYVSVICGVFILPDTAQSFFWLLSLLCLVRIFGKAPRAYWLLFGLFAGLSVLSKYHGVFLWAGAGLYILLRERKELANPYVYLGGLITIACFAPIIYWNQHHGWASFVYHGHRTLSHQALINWDNLLQQVLGEFFYNGLPVVALIFIAFFAFRRHPYLEKKQFVFLLCMSLPLIIFVWVLSTQRETLPHWTGPSYLSLMLLPAAWLDACVDARARRTPFILRFSIAFTALIIIAGLIVINTGIPGAPRNAPLDKTLGQDDFTLDMYGWRKSQVLIDSLLTAKVREGSLNPDYQFLQVNWFNGAHVDFYIARPVRKNTLVLGPLKNIHQFYWINQHHDWDSVSDYCMVTNSREYQALDQLPPFFLTAAHHTDTLAVRRGGAVAEAVFVTSFRNVPVDSVKAMVNKSYDEP